MDPRSSRPARKVAIADHLWDSFAEMAQAMGADREALINQAMFVFARLNGFLDAGAAGRPAATTKPSAPAWASSPTENLPTPPGLAADAPARRQIAERVLETADELERLIQERRPTPVDAGDAPGSREDAALEVGVESVLDSLGAGIETVPGEQGLHLLTEAGVAIRVATERFIIGRGKHCDHVIISGKVSREHAAITREGDAYFIEDLDSSNGTWFNKQRIKRRKVEPGDEYFICSERIRLVMR
ncbi:MAG: FHA domain-containing protein [Myxococcaceae bacterium]|nr:FHA domain-containing protein [Myxococcaceae bacterium]